MNATSNRTSRVRRRRARVDFSDYVSTLCVTGMLPFPPVARDRATPDS